MTRNNLLSLSLLLACAAPGVSMAQTAYLEQSGIVGASKTITISRVPTTQASGKVGYYDGAITLSVSPAGVPSVSSSTFTPSIPVMTDHFVPGRYYVKYGSQPTQFGSLTEGVGHGGSTVWSLVMDQAANGQFPDQATWQTGTPQPDVAARLDAAKVIIDPNDSYGIVDTGPTCFFGNNSLLSAKQQQSNLMLASYTYTCNPEGDSSQQLASIVLVHCSNQACSNAPP